MRRAYGVLYLSVAGELQMKAEISSATDLSNAVIAWRYSVSSTVMFLVANCDPINENHTSEREDQNAGSFKETAETSLSWLAVAAVCSSLSCSAKAVMSAACSSKKAFLFRGHQCSNFVLTQSKTIDLFELQNPTD